MNEMIMNIMVAAMGVFAVGATVWAFWLENNKNN